MKSSGLCLLLLVLTSGCATMRTIRIESSPPARVLDWGGRVVCETAPCTWEISRETCWLFDSSSGHVILKAELSDGVWMTTPAMTTCDIEENTLVRFELPSAPEADDCTVIIRDDEEHRFDDCASLMGRP